MSPEEKEAKRLFDLFMSITPSDLKYEFMFAKEACLIHLRESSINLIRYEGTYPSIEFLDRVKQEIEKL